MKDFMRPGIIAIIIFIIGSAVVSVAEDRREDNEDKIIIQQLQSMSEEDFKIGCVTYGHNELFKVEKAAERPISVGINGIITSIEDNGDVRIYAISTDGLSDDPGTFYIVSNNFNLKVGDMAIVYGYYDGAVLHNDPKIEARYFELYQE